MWPKLAIGWAVTLTLLAPLTAFYQHRQLRQALAVNRIALYRSALASQFLLTALTLVVDARSGTGGIALLVHRLALPVLTAWTAALLGGELLLWLWFLWQDRRQPDTPVLKLLPRTRSEYWQFVPVAVGAGVSEEYVVRGFLFSVVASRTGSLTLAYALTSIVFGAAHLYQGWQGAARATLIGALLGLPVVLAKSLQPAIVAHTALDLISARWGLRLLGRWQRQR